MILVLVKYLAVLAAGGVVGLLVGRKNPSIAAATAKVATNVAAQASAAAKKV